MTESVHHTPKRRRRDFLAGVKEVLPVCLGLLPLGFAFGLLVVQADFAWWWAPVFSTIIYAGSAEFLAIGLVTGGVGMVSAALTGAMVNFRHLFYGLTFPLQRVRSKLARAWLIYSLTDEVYAVVAAARYPDTYRTARLVGISLFCWLSWVVPGIIGAYAGSFIGRPIAGVEFALTALMVVLAVETFQKNKDYSLILSALVCGILASLLGVRIIWWADSSPMLHYSGSATVSPALMPL